MRHHAALGALAAFLVTASARADGASSPSPSAGAPSAAASSAPASEAQIDALRAELARQAAAIEDLQASAKRDRRARDATDVRVSGFTQIDWVIDDQASRDEINGSTGAPLNQDRFTLRRGHVRLDAQRGFVSGVLEIDANTVSGPQVRPIEASISATWPEPPPRSELVEEPSPDARTPEARVPTFTATMGLMRIPFGFEVQEVDYVRPYLERATMLQAMFPGEFDLGARFKMRYRFIDLAIAAMNGNPIGDKVFPDLDPVQTKDLVGRIGVDVEIAPGVRLQAGTSADAGTGFHLGTPATKNQLVWQDQNGDGLVEPNEIIAVGGTPATPSKDFHRFALGGDARIIVRVAPLGDFTLRAEAVTGLNIDRGLEVADPIGAGHDLREQGWSLGATQELTRWAMAGARFDVYDPDADASQQRALNLVPVDRTYSTVALMAMLRYRGARLLFEYDINTNPLGLGANGAPTTLADNAATLRGQVVF